jgi:hypothetical protein
MAKRSDVVIGFGIRVEDRSYSIDLTAKNSAQKVVTES